MNLYFQILTTVQTRDIAQLLLFGTGLGHGLMKCGVKISAGGKLNRQNFKSVQEAATTISHSKLNQLEISYIIGQQQKLRSVMPKSATGLLTPASTSELWYSWVDFPSGGDRALRNRRLNAKAAEKGLDFYKVTKGPSVLEILLPVHASVGANRALDECAEWLADCVPQPLEGLGIFGCADVDHEDCFLELEANMLPLENLRIMANLWPSSYPELGKRFDAIHSVLFGSLGLCKGLASSLGKGARLIQSRSVPNFAVVRISDDFNRDEAQRLASKWLVENTPPPGFK